MRRSARWRRRDGGHGPRPASAQALGDAPHRRSTARGRQVRAGGGHRRVGKRGHRRDPGGVRIGIGGTIDLSGECTTAVDQAECSGFLRARVGDLGGGETAPSSAPTPRRRPVRAAPRRGRRLLGGRRPHSFDGVRGRSTAARATTSRRCPRPRSIRFARSGGAGNDQLEGTPNDVLDAVTATTSSTSRETTTSVARAGSVAGGPGRDVVVAGQPRISLGLVLLGRRGVARRR